MFKRIIFSLGLMLFIFFNHNLYAQFNTALSLTNPNPDLYNYEQQLEEYQSGKLVPYVDFLFLAGFQFSFFNEQNSNKGLRDQLNFLKNTYNRVNPSEPYINNQNSTSGPIGLELELNIFFYDIGFGFAYQRNNFFNTVVSIQRDSKTSNNEDYFIRYIYTMAGHSFLFHFLYRFPLLKANPENNIYIVLGAGYNYNFGLVNLREKISFIGTDDLVRASEKNNVYALDGHGAHFIFQVLVKIDHFILSGGINWNILSFKNNQNAAKLLLPQYQVENFSLSLSPLIFFKTGFTF